MAVRAFVGVGSNLDPEANIRLALAHLARRSTLAAISTFYRTRALGGDPHQPDFVNGVVAIDTVLAPVEIKEDLLLPLEAAAGRVRSADRMAPRELDLDLLLYDELVLRGGALDLPHRDVVHRAFVAIPLAEIAPDLLIPGLGLHAEELARRFEPGEMLPLRSFTSTLRELLSQP